MERIATSGSHAADKPAVPHEMQMELVNLEPAAALLGDATQRQGTQAPAAGHKKMSLPEKTNVLGELINAGWLAYSPESNSYICLGVSLPC